MKDDKSKTTDQKLRRSLPTGLANALWYLASLPESRRLRRALCDVAGTQRRLLLNTLRRNRETRIGRELGFSGIRTVEEFQSRVPLASYESFSESIGRIEAGERRVLTAEDVLLMEPTSGSTAATKHVPYTATLKREFGRAIAAWIVDLYRHEPRLMRGQAYWSVTPVTGRNRRTAGGLPIGFEEDSEYFGRWSRYLVSRAMAVPALVRLVEDIEAFRYVTLLFLLRSRSLALISVWNPTFLTLLLERLPEWWRGLADDIESGTLSPPEPVAPDLLNALSRFNLPDPERAAEIRGLFWEESDTARVNTLLWPNLRLISCWADGCAAAYVGALGRLFPRARIQAKGLIATEGFVSLPIIGQPGSLPAIRSHFLEFLPVRGDGSVDEGCAQLVHELEAGACYEVVMTTGGGLYRYRPGDRVEVAGRWRSCPLIRFVGRGADTSDRVGEKLNEAHVRESLARALERRGVRPEFAMVGYEQSDGPGAYTLFIEAPGESDAVLAALGIDVEEALAENYHYDYCRKLGQLGPLDVYRVTAEGTRTFLSVCQKRGQRLGDIKPVALHRLSGWAEVFSGWFVSGDSIHLA